MFRWWLTAALLGSAGIADAQPNRPQSVYTRLSPSAPTAEREAPAEPPAAAALAPAVDEESVKAAVGPGSLTERVGAPWHADEMIGPIHADNLERVGFVTPPATARPRFDDAGWSSSLETVALWNNASYSESEDAAAIGARLTIGKEDAEGSGLEFRFATLNASNTRPWGRFEFEQQQLDLDLTQRVRLGDTSVTFGVGPRLMRYQTQQKGDSRYSSSNYDERFVGGGLGIGVAFDRILYRTSSSEFSLIGHARHSWLYGGVDQPHRDLQDSSMSFREVAGGVEWRRRWGDGDLVVHTLFEVQEVVFGQYGNSAGVALGIGYHW
ncbi:MAG: hypothetical protein AAF805_02195 [Planctomycetota bacterium]